MNIPNYQTMMLPLLEFVKDGAEYSIQEAKNYIVSHIQAKRWEGNVGSKEIRNFVGSLVGKKANKGVFITTSNYTNDALNYVKEVHHKVILIHGERLVELMMDYNVGVMKDRSYELKKMDHDYFEE
jgi:restriction system protein